MSRLTSASDKRGGKYAQYTGGGGGGTMYIWIQKCFYRKIGTASIFKVFWCMVFWSKFNFCYSDLYPKSSLLIRIWFKLIGIRNNDFHEFILNLTNYTVFYRPTGLDFWKLKLTGTRKPKVSYETPVLCVVLLTVRNGMVWNAYCIENKIN